MSVSNTFVKAASYYPQQPQTLKLHGVEAGGLWVESQKFIDEILTERGFASAPKTLVIFFPFHQIDYVFGAVESIALADRAFGV